VLKDLETAVRERCGDWHWRRHPADDGIRNRETFRKGLKFLSRESPYTAKEVHLVRQATAGIIKPVPVQVCPMDTKWSPNRIAELVRLQLILPGEDRDPVNLL
jgi:hypothetical protein